MARDALECLLIPTDFSRGARRAAERAALIPLSRGGRIHVVHVLPPGSRGNAAAREEAQRLLEKTVALIEKRTRAHGLQVREITSKALTGEPYVEIIRYSRAVDADLIVVGRKGSGGGFRTALGTTAARVVRMGDAPTLVVGTPAAQPYRRPMVAMDLDESARRLLRLVRSVSAPELKAIHVVHAYRVPFQGFIEAGTEKRPSLHHRQCKEDAQARLARLVESLEARGFPLAPILRHGDARSVILTEALRLRADLIAVGTHGRSGIAHALVGSVAETVVSSARNDVLIARPVRFTFELP